MPPPDGNPERVTFCLAGDVMTGRGIDQILTSPGDPRLHERWVDHAGRYVELAEAVNGPIPRGVAPGYLWGDMLAEIGRFDPDVRIVNLETAVTDHGEPWLGKGIHYRMHPGNIGCLTVAGLDCVSLANNHVLDWSHPGLEQTLDVLPAAGIATTGAGNDESAATAPATIDLGARRVHVIGVTTPSSGVPAAWRARPHNGGVALLDGSPGTDTDRIAGIVAGVASPGDLVVVSIHWGGNWGYDIPPAHRTLAHRLVDDAGVHIVHGHSSHHPLGVEIHHDQPVIYGAGDLITDYEGIPGHEPFRPHLGLMWMVTLDDATGKLHTMELVPTQLRRFRLERPVPDDTEWLRTVLHRESAPRGTTVDTTPDGNLTLEW